MDSLESLSTPILRSECMKKGIHYPSGIPLHAACKHELIDALRSPEYVEAFRLGLIGSDAS